jgi:ketosteroid isomerase-like protein
MRNKLLSTIGVLACLLAASFAQGDTRKEIEAFMARWCDACHRKDRKAIAEMVHPSFASSGADGRVLDRTAYLKGFEWMANAPDVRVVWALESLTEANGEATMWSRYTLILRGKVNGKTVESRMSGREVDVFKRTPQGWKLTYAWEYDPKIGSASRTAP